MQATTSTNNTSQRSKFAAKLTFNPMLAKKIGGAKRVPLFSALLMHAVYQKKYSKINLDEEAARAQAKQAPSTAELPARSKREQELREQQAKESKKTDADYTKDFLKAR